MSRPHPTELTVLFQRRPGSVQLRDGIAFTGYDIFWPDGQPVRMGLNRFCNIGSRLILGRRYTGDSTMVRLTIYPIPGLKAALTRPGAGIRCRRLYALREGDIVRFHFLDGTPTEAVFHATEDEPRVLRWLQLERMRPGEPFWFDFASQTIAENIALRA